MICTFYSYKGGVGRSMALANVADRLSRIGLKTLMVDFDLEAPGLERFFPINVQAARDNPGLLDLLVAYKQAMSQSVGRSSREFQELERFIFPVYYELPSGGLLHLLPAGRRGNEEQLSNYAYQLRTFDWQEFYFDWGGELFFRWLAREIGKRYDAALVDSRTGVTEMGGICAYQLADHLVMFCAPNAQNVQGTREVLRNFNSERVRALRKDRALQVLVAPARVQQDSPELEKFRAAFSSFEEFVPSALKGVGLSFWDLMVPYDPAFAFDERVTGAEYLNSDGALPRAYDRLAMVVASLGEDGSKTAEIARRMSVNASKTAGSRGNQGNGNRSDDSHRATDAESTYLTDPTGTPVTQPVKPQYDATTAFAGHDVFISYQRSDLQVVEALRSALQQAGCSVFFDFQQLDAGEVWDERIRSAIRQSAAVLVLVGAQMGQMQTQEVITAIKNERRIIPVLSPAASPHGVPLFLRDYHMIDLRTGVSDEALRTVVDAVIGTEKTPLRVAVAEENPYVGLRSLEESDARFFFGREALVAQAIEHLQTSSFLAVIGASGSGKSALLRAGIVPALRARWEDVRVAVVRPGSDPVKELVDAIAETQTENAEAVEDQFRRSLRQGVPIRKLLKPGSRLVIIVDQLEELWGLRDANERVSYLRLLASAAGESPEAIALIVALRADFYGEMMEDHDFGDLVSRNQLVVGPMTREELRQAIERPAQDRGISFEPGLVERILSDLQSSPGPLPVLQLLLFRLWADRRRGFITHESYERCGGLKVLAMTAEDAYNTLPAEQESVARNVFLRLVSPQGTRLSIRMLGISQLESQVIEHFVQFRLLRVSQQKGSSFVELAHEKLTVEWDRLARWTAEKREALEFRDRLQQDIEQGRALYRGQTLRRAQRWLAEYPDLASPEEKAFIHASRRKLFMKGFAAVSAATVLILLLLSTFALLNSYRRDLLRVEEQFGEATVVNYQNVSRKGMIVNRQGSALLLSGLTGNARLLAKDAWTAVLSPDARLAVVALRNRSVDVFDTETGALRYTFKSAGNALSLAVSDDSREIAVGTADGLVHIWSLTDARMLASAEPRVGPIYTLQFAGKSIVVNGRTSLDVSGH